MIILVRLPQYVADLQMRLIVVRPMLLAAVYWNPTVGAFEVDVGWRGTGLRRLACFQIHGVAR
jgi:hypothetical protein